MSLFRKSQANVFQMYLLYTMLFLAKITKTTDEY